MASPYKMKNSTLKMAGKGAPMQKNYAGSPMQQSDINVGKFMKLSNKLTRAKGGKVSYKSAWEAMDKKAKAKHGNFETFKGAAKDFNKKNPNYDKSKHDLKKHKDGTSSVM